MKEDVNEGKFTSGMTLWTTNGDIYLVTAVGNSIEALNRDMERMSNLVSEHTRGLYTGPQCFMQVFVKVHGYLSFDQPVQCWPVADRKAAAYDCGMLKVHDKPEMIASEWLPKGWHYDYVVRGRLTFTVIADDEKEAKDYVLDRLAEMNDGEFGSLEELEFSVTGTSAA